LSRAFRRRFRTRYNDDRQRGEHARVFVSRGGRLPAVDVVGGARAARQHARRRRGRERGGQRLRAGLVQRSGALGRGDFRHAGREVRRSGVRVEGRQPVQPGGNGRVRRGRHPASDRTFPERAQGYVVPMA